MGGYARLPELARCHATVCHADGEWARDEDGDGVSEVHDNTLEGIWTGLRNYLRTFRGVNKAYLAQYVAMFLWAYNIKAATDEYLRALMGAKVPTDGRTFVPHGEVVGQQVLEQAVGPLLADGGAGRAGVGDHDRHRRPPPDPTGRHHSPDPARPSARCVDTEDSAAGRSHAVPA